MHPLDNASFLIRLAAGVAAGTLTWFVASDVGALLLRLLRLQSKNSWIIGPALGYAVCGTVVGLMGGFRLLFGPLAGGLFVAYVAVRILAARRLPYAPSRALLAFSKMPALQKAAIGAAVFGWITAGVAAVLPASWWDPVAYHLPIVAQVLAKHAFAFDPGMVQTGFPLLGEAAALPAYAIAGSAGAAMATLGAGIALALLCGAWSESIAEGSGPLATALVSCSALWLWLAPSFYVDIPFALFAVAALAATALVRGDGEGPSAAALVVGLLAGAAAATKYPGLVVAAVGLLAVVGYERKSSRLRASIDFLAGAIALAGGWYVRTALLTGDPVFPFLTSKLASSVAVRDFADRYVAMTHAWCGGSATLPDALALPWRLLTEPRTFCGDAGYALDLGAVFVLASLAVFPRVLLPLSGAVVLTTTWFLTSQQWRFLVPAVCLFAIVAAVGATAATGRLRPAAHGALIALCVVGVLVNWLPGAPRDASNAISPAYSYIAGAQTADAYLSQRLESYDAAVWLREHAPGAPAVALDDVRDYYFGLATVWANPFYQSAIRVDWTLPAEQRYARLAEDGYRFIVVNANEAYVGRTPTGIDWKVLAGDVQRGILHQAFAANGVTVYELRAAR